jgi:hypothetical protein
LLPGMLLEPENGIDGIQGADKSASSLGQAVELCLDLQRAPVQT